MKFSTFEDISDELPLCSRTQPARTDKTDNLP